MSWRSSSITSRPHSRAVSGFFSTVAGTPGQVDLALVGTTAALCLAAGFFEVDSPGSSSLHPGQVFVFWAAMLLPGILLPVLAALCFLPSAVRRRAA